MWPNVLDEDRTLDQVLAGKSIARFGDGELNLVIGRNCITQSYMPDIGFRLGHILTTSIDNCLVGIPRMGIGPKQFFWSHFNTDVFRKLLGPLKFASAFITRPDSAPWIDRDDYWNKIKSLWLNKSVTLVRGSEKSLTASMLIGAAAVNELIVPNRNAFRDYKNFFKSVGKPDIAILCCGPTATVMAYDLAQYGLHAVDLGHIGMFLHKHHRKEPMKVTAADKAWDRC